MTRWIPDATNAEIVQSDELQDGMRPEQRDFSDLRAIDGCYLVTVGCTMPFSLKDGPKAPKRCNFPAEKRANIFFCAAKHEVLTLKLSGISKKIPNSLQNGIHFFLNNS